MRRIVAFSRVHYGGDFLEAVIRSTASIAEQHIICYTPHVSYGFNGTTLSCPDNRDDLFQLARSAAGHRLAWLDVKFPGLEPAMELRPDADMFIELDADEVLSPELAMNIEQDFRAGRLTAKQYRLPFLHFWRSFNYTCDDSSYPIRLYIPRGNEAEGIPFYDASKGRVWHFGYARSVRDMQYKISCSVHRDEFRPGWWDNVFMKFPERLDDLHPVSGDGFWNAKPFDKRNLPDYLRRHEYYNKAVIE